jgi:2-polyprenyl-3-methyl-5-hydroxy-6-metoxy-1,4-benzoquinol methylase
VKALDRALQRWRIGKVLPHIGPASRVLDVGSADGALFHSIRVCEKYVGIDPLVETTQSIGRNATIRGGEFPAALANNEQFDVICMLAVLEHVPPAAQAALATACGKHLDPGGKLLITVPSPRVDAILSTLSALRVIDGMSLEQHYGFDVELTRSIFESDALAFIERRRFQLGLNNLFVFERRAPGSAA